MTPVALELNDAGIVAAHEGGLVGTESPGIALLEGETLLVGPRARDRHRLRPRHGHERFWADLDREPAGAPFPAGWTRADLAYAHLDDVKQQLPAGLEQVVLCLPASFSRDQTRLLLGICAALELEVAGLVDSSLAAVSHGAPDAGRYLHVDLELHRAVLAQVTVGERLEAQAATCVDGLGVSSLRNGFAQRLAELLRQPNPLRPSALGGHGTGPLRQHADVARDPEPPRRGRPASSFDGVERVVAVSREELLEGVAEPYTRLAHEVAAAAIDSDAIIVSSRVAAQPGLCSRIEAEVGLPLRRLPPGAAALGALSRAHEIERPGSALVLVQRLGDPASGTSSESETAPLPLAASAPVAASPSHLVLEGLAYLIGPEGIAVGVDPPTAGRHLVLQGDTAGVSRHHCTVRRDGDSVRVEDHSSWGTFVNDEPIREAALLAVGDRLRIGTPGVELHLIAFARDDGAT